MNYDKNSFLAGLSVGRTLKGWSSADSGESDGGCGGITMQADGFLPVSSDAVAHSGAITMQADGFLPVSSDAVAHSGAIIMNATAILVE